MAVGNGVGLSPYPYSFAERALAGPVFSRFGGREYQRISEILYDDQSDGNEAVDA